MAMSNETMNMTERDDSNFFIRFVKYFIPWKGDKSSEVVRKIVFMFSIVLFSMSINQLKNYLVPSEEAKSYTRDVVEQYEPKFDENVNYEENSGSDDVEIAQPETRQQKREVQDWAKDLLERNDDVVGWIKIPGLEDYDGNEYINFPVLQGENNDYYLYKNIDRDYYESGSIFVDAWSVINDEDQTDNLTIFGHHMGYVGTSFTHLSEYKQGADFLKEHPIIEFNSIYENNCKYAIVSCFMINTQADDDDGNLFEYIGYRDFNDEDYLFDTWYDEISKRNWYTNDIKCTADDKYITLSTCSKLIEENLRWVIVAKKLTPEDNIDHIVESYQDKDDKDIYFPAFWRERYGNNKVDQGWQL